MAEMIQRSNPIPFEERNARIQELTFEKCLAFCRDRGVIFDPKININFGFWNPKIERWTNLAYLCSDQARIAFVLVHFSDEEKTEIVDSQRIRGGLFSLLEEAIQFVSRSNSLGMMKPTDGSLERKDLFRVSPDAIREAIVNQIVHCDYSRDVPNSIRISPKVIEFWTPGGPYHLMPKDILEDMATSCRNPNLAALLMRLKLMEGLGSGFKLIRKVFRGIPMEHLVTISHDAFKISLPRIQFEERIKFDDRQKKIIEYVLSRSFITRKEVEELIHLSQAMSASILRKLVEMKVLVKEGTGPKTRYSIAPGMKAFFKNLLGDGGKTHSPEDEEL